MAKTLLDELLVGLGFDYDPTELEEFKQGIDKSVKSIKAIVKAAAAGAVAITGLTVASTKASDEQGKLALEIGETTDNIESLEFALRRSGGEAGSMGSTLKDLAIRASEAARGTGSGVEAFGILGVSVTDANGALKSASGLMLEVSERMQGLNRLQQLELADKLGLRGSIRLLQQGPAAIRELQAEALALGTTTAEDAEIAADFQDSLTDLWAITKHGARLISREVAPVLTDMVGTFKDWWKSNRELIEQNIPMFVEKLTGAFKLLTIAVGAFIGFQLASHLIALIGLLRGVAISALLVNGAIMLLPALIFTLATAFVALMEDAKVFFEGGESFIGDMIDKYPQWTTQLGVVAGIFATFWDLTSKIWEGWKGIFGLFDDISMEKLKTFFKNIPGFLLDVTGIQSPGDNIPNTLSNSSSSSATYVDKIEITVDGGIDSAQTIAETVFNMFQQSSQDLNSAVDQ